jgi:hypothetical protein
MTLCHSIRLRRGMRAAALGLATVAAACAGDGAEQLLVRPGRFDYLSCPDIAKTRENAAKREQELKILIDRAEKESFGVLMAAASYRGDYLQAQGQQKMLAEVARQKNCAAEQSPAGPVPARR